MKYEKVLEMIVQKVRENSTNRLACEEEIKEMATAIEHSLPGSAVLIGQSNEEYVRVTYKAKGVETTLFEMKFDEHRVFPVKLCVTREYEREVESDHCVANNVQEFSRKIIAILSRADVISRFVR